MDKPQISKWTHNQKKGERKTSDISLRDNRIIQVKITADHDEFQHADFFDIKRSLKYFSSGLGIGFSRCKFEYLRLSQASQEIHNSIRCENPQIGSLNHYAFQFKFSPLQHLQKAKAFKKSLKAFAANE